MAKIEQSTAPVFGFTATQVLREDRVKQSEIDDVKTWLTTQDNFIPNLCDEQIVIFLLSCNRNTNSTCRTIKEYYKLKRTAPHFFIPRDIDSDNTQKILRSSLSALLPRTDDNCALFAHKITGKASEFDLHQMVQFSMMFLDSVLYDNPANGFVIVVDMAEVGLMHLTKLRYSPLKVIFAYLQEGYPLQLKRIHFVNIFPQMDKLMAMTSPFMKKETLESILYYQPGEDFAKRLHKHVPKRCLPKEYGGDLPSLSVLQCESVERLKKLKDFLQDEEKQWHFKKA